MHKKGTCSNCKRENTLMKGKICVNCYKKYFWKRKSITCKRCMKLKPNHAQGLCAGCYHFVFSLERNKAHNIKKWYGLNLGVYKKITEKCVVCRFDKVVDLHHLDENHKNNDLKNLIGLCPNHHKMLHDFRYRKEIRSTLKEKGFSVPQDPRLDFVISQEELKKVKSPFEGL